MVLFYIKNALFDHILESAFQVIDSLIRKCYTHLVITRCNLKLFLGKIQEGNKFIMIPYLNMLIIAYFVYYNVVL